jgi:hypothetical protein
MKELINNQRKLEERFSRLAVTVAELEASMDRLNARMRRSWHPTDLEVAVADVLVDSGHWDTLEDVIGDVVLCQSSDRHVYVIDYSKNFAAVANIMSGFVSSLSFVDAECIVEELLSEACEHNG